MDSKIEIKGKTLLFGRAGFFEHVEDVTKEDPIQWMQNMLTRFVKQDDGKWAVTSVTREVAVYAYAGLNLNADENDEDNISFEKVKKWVRTLSFEECGKIVNAAVEAMSASTNGLGEKTTQPVS